MKETMMKKTKKFICTLAAISMVMLTYNPAQARFKASGPVGAQEPTSDAIILQWNEIAVATIGAQPPFPSTRYMATVQVAVFEAVNAITGDYEPYLGTISAPPGPTTVQHPRNSTLRRTPIPTSGSPRRAVPLRAVPSSIGRM